jgi:lambda family phage tail tape measure protein
MTALGSVVVELSANVARFQSDMGKAAAIAERHMQDIDKSIGFVKTSLGVLGAGFLANATFDKIKEKIEGAIASAAGLQQLSERTGAAVEQLSGLSAVAKLSGTGTDELATGLQKLSKSMIDAENGGQKTGESFKAIGISIAELKGKRPDEVFMLIAQRLDKYQDGAEKTVIAQNLLGKSGANLLPVMRDLAEVGDLQVKVTKEQAKAADDLEKNQTRLEASTNAIYRQIAMELVPTLNDLVKELLETQNRADGVKKSVNDLAQNGSIREWAQGTALAAATVIETFQFLIKAALAVGGSFQSVFADLGVLGTFEKNGGVVGLAFESNRKELSDALEKRNKTVADANARYSDLWNYDSTAISRNLKARFAASNAEADFYKNADAKDLRFRAKTEPKGVINTSLLGNKNLGPADDPAKKELEGKLKAQEDFIAAEKAQLQTREQYLDFYHGLEYFSLRDIEEKKQALIAANLVQVQAAYDKEIVSINAYIAQAAKLTDKADGRNKLAEAVKKRAAAEVEANKQIGDSQNKLLAVQRQFDLATDERARQDGIANKSAKVQIDLLGKNTLEVLKAVEARRIQLALDERIFQLKKQDPNADTSAAIAQAAIQTANATALIEASYNKQRDAIFGASEAVRKYREDAANTGAHIESAMTNAFKGMEDALVMFATTGKLSFKSLADSIVADITRIIIKQQISNALGVGGGAGGGMGLIGTVIGAISGTSGLAATASAMSGDSLDNMLSLTNNFAGRASGGPVSPGSLYQVNENGPELLNVAGKQYLMMGSQGGSVEPTSQTAAAGNTYITVQVTPPAGASRESAQQWGATASRELQRATRRNG